MVLENGYLSPDKDSYSTAQFRYDMCFPSA